MVRTLMKADNLILHLSLDPVNIVEGLQCYADNDGQDSDRLQLCYMSHVNDMHELRAKLMPVFEATNAIRKAVGLKPKPLEWLSRLTFSECPVDTGKLKTEYGCMACKACLTRGKHAVWFKS